MGELCPHGFSVSAKKHCIACFQQETIAARDPEIERLKNSYTACAEDANRYLLRLREAQQHADSFAELHKVALRERDEARQQLRDMQANTVPGVQYADECIRLERERDEARAQLAALSRRNEVQSERIDALQAQVDMLEKINEGMGREFEK